MMDGLYLFIIVGSIIAVLITLLLGWLFRRIAFIKYIPAIISALCAIGLYLKARAFSEGFTALGYVILALIAFIIFFVSLITAFIMGLAQRKNKKL